MHKIQKMKINSGFFKMAHSSNSAIVYIILITWELLTLQANGMSQEERYQLKERTLEMFNHAYKSYMDHAYPADELMPLSCKGRYRGSEPSRGDVDESLGNFSLSLIDSLDTLIVLGNFAEFEKAVKLVIRDVTFDTDVVVSVFETNIRVLGGLIGGHVFSEWLRDSFGRMKWYSDELLTMAKEIGDRLLPAFNTTSGVPYPRINLKTGLKNLPKVDRETCTACAGTMVLEFAALSRLAGNPVYEEKAHKAMEFLWQQRHRTSHLMGTVFNVHNGEWVRRDSGVGAGIDSYYEYLLKAYILLGDETYLERFDKHYNAIMKYVSQGPMLLDVHMHRPNTAAKNFMNSLLAFWPGLQVLFGDLKPAIETHEMLYQVMRRHKFLPEAFTTEFKVYWGQHPLRPEFIESTYFIYKATGDPYYLEVGKDVLDHLENYARVPCGFAGVKDVRTGSHEDRMDSFVLAELFKYLYLLFAEKEDLLIDVDNYIFTTEAHLIPLNLPKSMLNASFIMPGEYETFQEEESDDFEGTDKYSRQTYRRTCPNTRNVFSGNVNYAHRVRERLKDMVENQCPKPKQMKRKLRASEFEAGNENHMMLLQRMGIHMVALKDGRVQLMHTSSQAASSEEAEEGLLFMQEMIELSNTQNQQIDQQPRIVQFISPPYEGRVVLTAGPAQFGFDLQGTKGLKGAVIVAEPFKACTPIENAPELSGTIAVVERGDCMFIEKARNLMHAGAIGGIVIDSNEGTSSSTSPMFAMSGDGSKDVNIPLVFLFHAEGQILLHSLQTHSHLEVYMTDSLQSTKSQSQESENNDDSTEADGVTVQMMDSNDEGTRFIHTEKTYKLFPDNDAIKDYIPEDNMYLHVQHTDLTTDIRFMHIHVEEAYTDNCMTNTVTQQVRTNIERSGKIQSIVNIERNADNVRRIHFKMFDVTRKFVRSNLFHTEKQDEDKEEMQALEKFQLILEMQDKIETYTNIANLPNQRDNLVALIRLFEVILGGDKVFTHTHQESVIDFIKNAKPKGVYPNVQAHFKEQQSDSDMPEIKIGGKGDDLIQNVDNTGHESEEAYHAVHQDIETILKTYKDDLPSEGGKVHFKIMVEPGVEETVSVKLGEGMNKVFDKVKGAVFEKLRNGVSENGNSVTDDQPNDRQETDSSNQKDEL